MFDWPEDRELLVPGLKNDVEQAYLLAGQTPLETQSRDDGVVVSLPALAPDPINSVVVLKVRGALEIESQLPTLEDDGSLVLSADAAYIHNNEGRRDARVVQREETANNIGYWTDADAWVEWSFEIDQPGQYEILAELAVEEQRSRFRIELAGQQKSMEVASTGGYGNYVHLSLGKLTIEKVGECSLKIRPEKGHWQPINLRQLKLKLQ